jgi:hypothetical protein
MGMGSGIDQLQAWTCVKCGAALPAEAATGELVTCGYCGTPFSLPTAQTRRSGVTISGESITIGGDIIGGSKRVIVTSEAPSAATIWDEPDTDDREGISIEGEGIQVYGDVVSGSVVKIVQPPPAVKAEPVAAQQMQMELALNSAVEEKSVVPEAAPTPVPKLGWWEKVKRLFSN